MSAPSLAVRPIAAGGPRRAAAAPSDASERASGKKRSRVTPAQDSSTCLSISKTSSNSNSVVTAAGIEVFTVGGQISSQELLQKRLASELDVLRRILQKAERISRGGEACKGGGAPNAGKKERFLAAKSNKRAKPIENGGAGNAPSVKRRKISMTLAAEESKDDKVAEESKERKVAEESKGEVVVQKEAEEYADISGGLSRRDPDTTAVQQSGEAKKVQAAAQRAAPPKPVDMRDLLDKAKLRRQLLEMERAALPDQSINPRDLQRLGIKGYGYPSLMHGLTLKVA